MSGDNSRAIIANLASQAVSALVAQVRGELIQPSDTTYDEARNVYNAMIDKHPALILSCFTGPTCKPCAS